MTIALVASSATWEIPNFNIEVDEDAKVNKKNHLRESLAKLIKGEPSPEFLFDMVNLSRFGPCLTSIEVTNFMNEFMPKNITTKGLF